MSEITAAALAARTGEEIGVSRWFEMTQAMIDAHADVSEDHQFIHIDPTRAAETPFGGTIAHGFLTLSMLSAMASRFWVALRRGTPLTVKGIALSRCRRRWHSGS